MKITAKIENMIYKPRLCRNLSEFSLEELEYALTKSSFLLDLPNRSKVAISRWVSPKRTRSYPYSRVYDTLNFKPRITIIPVVKDEGIDGDRDYLQFDTVSMMSLLGVNVIVTYYVKAIKNARNPLKQKITGQEFDPEIIKNKILEISDYHSDSLHWNLKQLEEIKTIGQNSLTSYANISKITGVPMHRTQDLTERFQEIGKSLEDFKSSSRKNAKQAAQRETQTSHQTESTVGEKPTISIENYLGGKYYLTVDEIHINKIEKKIQLIEAKNTTNPSKPFTSMSDIKDAIFKMIIFKNLVDVKVDGKKFTHESVVKLTAPRPFQYKKLDDKQKLFYDQLQGEAKTNKFSIIHE